MLSVMVNLVLLVQQELVVVELDTMVVIPQMLVAEVHQGKNWAEAK